MEIPLKLKYRTHKQVKKMAAHGDGSGGTKKRMKASAAEKIRIAARQPYRVMLVNAQRGSHIMVTRTKGE